MRISKKELYEKKLNFPMRMLPVVIMLANLIFREKKKEVEVKPFRKNLTLEYVGKPIKINPVVLLNTGAQVSCLKKSVFE